MKLTEKKTKSKKMGPKLDLEEMMKAGLHFGHRSSKYHPKMKPFLYGMRNGIYIIDLAKTREKLKEALEFIKELIEDNKILLFIGTKVQIKDLVKKKAQDCGLSYVSERWLGGTFTNFDIIQKRIKYFKELEKKQIEGELEKYTKKEQAEFVKELKELELKFGGIKELTSLPDAIFVVDMKENAIAVKEAREKGIKVIGLTDTNIDPTLADFPIPASDDSISSVQYVLTKVKEVILKAQQETKKKQKTRDKKEKTKEK
jgi:small subunit ribosomal protein S2